MVVVNWMALAFISLVRENYLHGVKFTFGELGAEYVSNKIM